MRVAKHRSKLRSFYFKVRYEPGAKNPSDYGFRHPPPLKKYSREDKTKYGVKEEEDSKIVIAQLNKNCEAVTMEMLQNYTNKELKEIWQQIEEGNQPKGGEFKECFWELSLQKGIMRGEDCGAPNAASKHHGSSP